MNQTPPVPQRQRPVLITSFRPWKVHQAVNSSDILVTAVESRLPENAVVVRNLPVSFDLAPLETLQQVMLHRPRAVVCCGMAEKRPLLTVERYGTHDKHRLETPLDLHALIDQTIHTRISISAGSFVCNRLYYRLLRHLQQSGVKTPALFVHVPLITDYNRQVVEFDFLKIIRYLNAAPALR